MTSPQCSNCDDTGYDDTGNNVLPCSCLAGATALFSITGVEGEVTGEEMRRHFFNGSPEPISHYDIANPFKASSLPGRESAQ
jgi:hypothetical protein